MTKQIINGTYEITDKIGSGGQSDVFKAKHLRLGTAVAVKRIDKRITSESFLAEVNILKNLNQANLTKIYDISEDDKYAYIVEEFVDGMDLEEYAKEQKKIPEKTILEWFKTLCQVLKYLHDRENPIVFGDLKPKNIMLQKDGVIKLIDFGIAREYVPSEDAEGILGYSPGYGAPEILEGNTTADIRSDIYSLGVTIHRLATGQKPNPKNSTVPLARTIDPSLSVGLETIINKCVQIRPEDRYQTADEVLYDLENIRQYDIHYQNYVKSQKRRNTLAIFLYALAILLIVGGFFVNRQEILSQYYNLIDSSQEENISLDEKVRILDQAIELSPNRTEAYLAKANVYYSAKRYQQTVDVLKNVLSNLKRGDDQMSAYSMIGSAYYELHDYAGAAEIYQLLTENYEAGEDTYLNYATCLIQLGRNEEAMSIMEKIAGEGSEVKETFIRGEVAFINKNYAEAEDLFLSVIQDNSESELTYRSYMNLISIYRYAFRDRETVSERIGDENSKSISTIATVMNTYGLSSDPVLWEEKGLAYFNRAVFEKNNDAEDLNEAINCFKNVLDLGLQSEHIYTNILTCYEILKDYGSALATVSAMKENYPESSNVYVQSSRLYMLIEATKSNQNRDYSKAYEDYLTAKEKLKSGESDEQIRQLESLIEQLRAGGGID